MNGCDLRESPSLVKKKRTLILSPPTIMGSSSTLLSLPQISPIKFNLFSKPQNKSQLIFSNKPTTSSSSSSSSSSSLTFPTQHQCLLHLAASIAILLSPAPAKAGLLSGFPGLESVPGPQLPQIEFLNRFNEENQKKYAEADEKFKSSPLLKKLLEQSKLNKEKNKQEIQDKYCVRGAEWGVGDCSAEGMSPEDKDKFIAMLKQKAGMTD